MLSTESTPFWKSLSQPVDQNKPPTRKEIVLFAHHLYTSADSLRCLGVDDEAIESTKLKALNLMNRDAERRR